MNVCPSCRHPKDDHLERNEHDLPGTCKTCAEIPVDQVRCDWTSGAIEKIGRART